MKAVNEFDSWFGTYPLLVFPLKIFDRGARSGFLHPRKVDLEPGQDWGIFVSRGLVTSLGVW